VAYFFGPPYIPDVPDSHTKQETSPKRSDQFFSATKSATVACVLELQLGDGQTDRQTKCNA